MMRISALILLATCFALAACGEKKVDEPKADEPKPEEAKPEEAKPEEVKPEEAKPEEAPPEAAAAPKVDDMLALLQDGAKKSAVKFPHKAHTEFEVIGGKCGVCHHAAGEDHTSIKGCMAEGCHDGKTEGVLAPKDAFHKTCKDGCHKDVIKEGKSDKLKKVNTCSGCHPK